MLERAEYEQVKGVFVDFGRVEGSFLIHLDSVADWLANEAEVTLNLFDSYKIEEANARIRTASILLTAVIGSY